ncbi:MAG: hypothetical protein WD738_19375 [Pirellulales bacterium]
MRFGSIMLSLITAGLFFVAGCRKSDSIGGTVTYNGEPVEKGSIMFASADGSGPGFGAMVVDGKYTADKARPGEHVALVRGVSDQAILTKEQFLELHEQHHIRFELPGDYIPDDADGNGQSVEIQGGGQTLNFELKGPPRPK